MSGWREARSPGSASSTSCGSGSEERRVGEEGRSRGGPDHLKKKKEKWEGAVIIKKKINMKEMEVVYCKVRLKNILEYKFARDGRLCGLYDKDTVETCYELKIE